MADSAAPHLEQCAYGRAVLHRVEEGGQMAALLMTCRARTTYGNVNIDVWGFRKSSLRAPASQLPDRFQTMSPRVMSDS